MKIVNEKEFNETIGKGVTLVDFFATWCGPCKLMASVLEDIGAELGQRANVIKVDVDQEENLARTFGILSIPSLLVFKDGELVEKHVGVWDKDECVKTVEKYL